MPNSRIAVLAVALLSHLVFQHGLSSVFSSLSVEYFELRPTLASVFIASSPCSSELTRNELFGILKD
jgi:hypothetical protein